MTSQKDIRRKTASGLPEVQQIFGVSFIHIFLAEQRDSQALFRQMENVTGAVISEETGSILCEEECGMSCLGKPSCTGFQYVGSETNNVCSIFG